jgi:hypothetical protein
MFLRKAWWSRAAAVGAMVLFGAVAGVTVNAPSAAAEARCTSDGRPTAISGRFYNQSYQGIQVKGDKLVNGAFKTIETTIRTGWTAWDQSGMCDADYIRPYRDFIYAGSWYEGDVWQKITGSWTCYDSGGILYCG